MAFRRSLLEQRIHELVGVERLDVVGLLAEADELDGQVNLVAHADDDAALGGAVELGEKEIGRASCRERVFITV